MDRGLRETWVSRTGRCTSFCVKVAHELSAQYPGTYDFKIHDLGGHRLAHCTVTGVVIDSSSDFEAIQLVEGEWRLSGSKRRESSEGTFQFQAGNGRIVCS